MTRLSRRGTLPAGLATGLAAALILVTAAAGFGSPGTAAGGIGPQATPEITKVADPITIGTVPVEAGNTQHLGRIWTDKTVSTGPIELTSGNAAVANDADFLVALSALSSSARVTGVAEIPLDTVFVLDLSGSMGDAISAQDPAPKYQVLVRQVNKAISDLMRANPLNRVAVVGFSGALWHMPGTFEDTTLFMPLAHYAVADSYFTYTPGDTPVVTANSVSREVVGGTDIQAGMYKGMELLTASDPTYVPSGGGTAYRIPSVVLVSDGAPTFTRNSATWWNLPETGLNSQLQGNGQDIYAGNSFVALLTTAFMKKKVEAHYDPSFNTATEPVKTRIYTVGVGLGDDSTDPNDPDLAHYTLDPTGQAGQTNAMATAVEGYWTAWSGGGSPAVCVDGAAVGSPCDSSKDYTVGHPSDPGDTPYAPTAIAYNNLFVPVASADQLCNAFQQITDHIVTNEEVVPTRVFDVDGTASGYITFTDQLGDYMEVKDFKAVAYGDTVFTQKSSSTAGGVTTYVFTGTFNANSVYRYGDLSRIVIQVTHGTTSDLVTVKVPAALIPLREFSVILDAAGEVAEPLAMTDAYPVSVFYTVGLKDGVAAAVAAPGGPSDAGLAAYAAANRDASGEVQFYSNAFDRATAGQTGSTGLTTAGFEPNLKDSHYYFLTETPLFSDAACTVAATTAIQPGTPYYFAHSYYQGLGAAQTSCVELAPEAAELTAFTGGDTTAQGVSLHGDSTLWINQQTKHVTQVEDFYRGKDANPTGTAATAIVPAAWDGTNLVAATAVTVHLGNNGRLAVAPQTEPSTAPPTPSTSAPSTTEPPQPSSSPASPSATEPAPSKSGSFVPAGSLPITGAEVSGQLWLMSLALLAGLMALAVSTRYRRLVRYEPKHRA
ncbi:MAG: VWA domain-containing protein [Bifidobacteriaceae bacterium]|jgi:hypothetical protein|nr:VWA domain-containing protein [Bifidobacteriaceae bacterium]